MDRFSIVRQIPLGAARHTLGVLHDRNMRRTNPEKTWKHYAGTLIMDGGGVYHDWRGRSHETPPGSLVHHLPGRWHSILRTPEGWHEYAILADTATCHRWIGLGLIDEEQPVQALGDPQTLLAGFLNLRRLLETERPSAWRQALIEAELLLLSCWELNIQRQVSGDGTLTLESAADRLAADHAAHLSLENVAAACGLGYVVFRRRFKDRFGHSPGAWRNHHRLAQAAVVLAHRRTSIAELAAELGYADQFAFSRRFTQHHGCSPSSYRRNHFAQ